MCGRISGIKSQKDGRVEEETPDTRQGSLEGRHALLFQRTFPLFTLPLPFPFFLSLQTSDFPKTLRGRLPAEQSQSHHLDLSKHSGEGGVGGLAERREGEGDKMREETNSLHDTG